VWFWSRHLDLLRTDFDNFTDIEILTSVMSNKARDASPIRTRQLSFEEECLRIGCSKQHRWLLLFCGILLECDVPILEALFWPTMAYLGPRSIDTIKAIYGKMEIAIHGHFQQMCPQWLRRDQRLYTSPTHYKSVGILSRAGKCIDITSGSLTRKPGCNLVLWTQDYTLSFVDREYLTIYNSRDGRISIRPGQFNATIEASIQPVLDINSALREPVE